ncbi:Ran binding protein-like, CRA domain protein [Metarhizium album ARSEF 1941]|uniref:GID complex catalytic subunit 2 n=1 Tax=Metarhizium album (strain ARSEF 1941) TaxID=1081103 RepID=A0A0B2WZA0_METAS|nr:Ran binding protein-like, CRA domain protein [Metarhizium album ARSEF 1941]KHN98904.1 Ran binding protein-like, CRA domain protein [Metarhizium album ARSEF 1941]
MAGTEDDMPSSPFGPLLAELARMRKSNLNAAINDVDSIIDLLTTAREQVAGDDDAHKISMAMTTLQNPVKARFEAITDDLKDVTKAQRGFGKALDRALPHRELPMETDAMADHPELINRAIAMHLLREGQFSVASTFLQEEQERREQDYASASSRGKRSRIDEDGDDEMKRDDDDDEDMQGLHSEDLQDKFSEMYRILAQLKERNLVPAIEWARINNPKLETKGSNLEFELSKLQFVWLFKGPSVNSLPDDAYNGQMGALAYARQHFGRFQSRHIKEIQQLCCAMVYAPNLEESPYRQIFEIDSAFEDVATSFTREFCSLLGLSAESPLYMAVTAGSIALPRLIKYTTYMKEKKTEWTTENELAFETPLPPSMIYHPIFVCPVSKEQTTEQNPPMMLPCGHVICKESLQNIAAKGSRYKCPYCPTEGHLRDAIKITL